MSTLQIHVEAVEGVAGGAIVHLEGDLDQPTLNTFLSQLEAVRNEGKSRVLLDMDKVGYANSTALGALITQADTFREAGGEMALVRPQPKVELVIDMLGLGALLKIFNTMDEARQHLASGSRPSPAAPHPQAAAAPAAAPAAFPVRSECAGCGVLLEFSQASHFRCPHCGAVYSVDGAGHVSAARAAGGQPIEITLTCHPSSLEAFQHFIGALPAWAGYSEIERTRLEGAIAEVCDAIRQKAYAGNESETFQVLVISRPEELDLRVADHGATLDPSAFPAASDYMSEFEHRPHPTKGNLLKMVKRAR
jgi:anti-anti-sigma factor